MDGLVTTSRQELVYCVEAEQDGVRIDIYLPLMCAGLSRGKARKLLAEGAVCLNGVPVRVMSRRVYRGDRISLLQPVLPEVEDVGKHGLGDDDQEGEGAEQEERMNPFVQEIAWDTLGGRPVFLYRDDYLAVVNKPAGIPTEPTRDVDIQSSLRQVEASLREAGLHPRRIYVVAVHRLDAPASGALVFALRKQAAAALSAQFANRTAGRLYRALVVGNVASEHGELRDYLGRISWIRQGVVPKNRGKLAITEYRVVERFADATLVELKLQTGRTHQIRVQMAAAGHPLIGDWMYCSEDVAQRCPPAQRLMLHACSLTLVHPHTQETMEFSAALPDDFAAYLEQLRLSSSGVTG